ncbi:MAG: hypothetical protein CVU40_12525 [Chloroflexi bacterium HGW-Chloroflexi-2]|jgi:hypothetical protein|nr:MAG: hypothetical protein CVU40_12525 [Chloroflexi bacterium HGW-Chloroflexi-2]
MKTNWCAQKGAPVFVNNHLAFLLKKWHNQYNHSNIIFENPMDLLFHHSYNLDLLNLLNIVGVDSPYKTLYPQIYSEFGQPLSLASQEILKQVSAALGSALISPAIAFVLSIIPQFDKAPLLDLMLDQEGFLAALEQNEPRLLSQKDQLFILFQVLAPVIQEIELLGFREYWLSEFYPVVEERVDQMDDSLFRLNFMEGVNRFFKQENLPEEVNIFLSAFNAHHGVRLTRHNSMLDISFSDQKILDFSLHEVIQSAVTNLGIPDLLHPLVEDPFIRLAFEKSKSVTAIEEIETYIQENIVEACKVYLLYKHGFLPDPYSYLQSHQQGAFILAVIILDFLEWNPNSADTLTTAMKSWMDQQPVGNLMMLYQQAMQRAGKEIGDS